MGRVVIVDTGWYSAGVPGTGAAAVDVLEVKLGTAQFGFLMAAFLFQSSEETITDIEEIKVAIKRASGSFTSGSGGGTATVVKGATGDAAHGLATIEMFNTTPAVVGSGTLETIMPGTWNIPAGEWERTYIPELRPPLGPSEAIILSLEEAFADTATIRGLLIFDIYG